MYRPLLAAISGASLALLAACSTPYDQPAPVPYVAGPTQYVVMPSPAVAHNCIDYGFIAGTLAYDRCVARESQARALGRMTRDYAFPRIEADARDACFSYGLEPGTARYARCVGREIDARSYRAETVVVTQPTPVQYVYPSTYDRRVATTGVEITRDEYGFRYDAQGNRLDRNGNIISPQSTQP